MRLLRVLAPVTCVLAVLVTRPAPFAAFAAGAERTVHRTLGDDNVICRIYLDPHNKFTRVDAPAPVPPADEWSSLVWTESGSASAVTANITVNYTGFTGTAGDQARVAFQAAVDIWKTQITSTVPIVVDAEFKDLISPGLLGSAGSAAVSDFTGATRAGTWFPFPLANKLAGTNLGAQFAQGPTLANIGATFNSTASWYYGTDGVVPAGKVDFESVVLHELGHGLGFYGSGSVVSGTGSIGAQGMPYIYDTFPVDSVTGGNALINPGPYPNPSPTLATALTNSSVYWDGTNGKSSNGGARPRLWAPNPFFSGSSFSHLDEGTYPPGTINSLMTPSIGFAEAIHTPGPIMLGMFADMGWGSQTGAQCSFALDRTSATVPSAGGNVSVTLSTASSCAWTSSTAASFVTISPAAGGTGSQVFTLVVGANGATSLRTATVTLGGVTFSISQNGTGPAMSLDKTSLIFTAVSNGAAITATTSAQAVRLTQTGAGTVTWTATSNQPWLLVSAAASAPASSVSASGSATLSISAAATTTLAATQAGSVTLTFSGAGNSAGPISATLKLVNIGLAAAPTGSFDTPTDNSTGVTGSIAVTGWAIDDVEVRGVRILRDPVAGEAAGLVPIGSAMLVDGARPDIQAMFPTSPRSSRAGWGYLMLTNFLPGLGNGTFKLYAVADDADGHSTVLGTKTITCTNSSATAPFGAIDTPTQGGTVSGNVINFGWVLSKGPARTDPPAGGTVRVVIDGAVIPGVPSGWTSRADLSALFPAAAYPGIGTALGVAAFDSTTLANGVHTIAWLVTDNQTPAGASGIGSRYFTVSNGSLYLDPSASALSMPRAAALRFESARALAAEIDAVPPGTRTISGRRGFDLDAPLRAYGVRNGLATIHAEELDRIELQLEGVEGARRRVEGTLTGYVRVGDGLAPLPIGSSLNSATGAFTWQPGVAFVGKYDLVFVRWAGGRVAAKQDVRIILNPKGSNRVGPQVVIDTPGPQQDVAQPFVIAGWAADLDSTIDVGVDAVHVWAYPLRGGDPLFIGAAAVGGRRPDVAAVYGERFANSGYGIRLKGLEHGNYDIAVFAYSTVTGGFVPAKTVRLTVR